MLEPIMKGRAAVPVRVAENMANSMPNMAVVVVPAIMLRNMLYASCDELLRENHDGRKGGVHETGATVHVVLAFGVRCRRQMVVSILLDIAPSS